MVDKPLDAAAPYRYRVAVPLVARRMPAPPEWIFANPGESAERTMLFRFASLNLIGLALAAWFLFLLMGDLGFSTVEALLGGMLFLCSMPPLTIGTLPLVDAWAYALLAGCLLALLRRQWVALCLLFALGALTKETIFLVPLAALLLPSSRADRLRQALCLAPVLVGYAAFRLALAPPEPLYSLASSRQFGQDLFVSGAQAHLLSRGVRAFGVLWLLALCGWLEVRHLRRDPLTRWSLLVPLILVVPFVLALNLGRVWFFAFPVIVPLAVRGLATLWRDGTAPQPRPVAS